MDTSLPDYGEPWQATTAREGSIITCDDQPILESFKLVKRAVVCVNACAGMADPAAGDDAADEQATQDADADPDKEAPEQEQTRRLKAPTATQPPEGTAEA